MSQVLQIEEPLNKRESFNPNVPLQSWHAHDILFGFVTIVLIHVMASVFAKYYTQSTGTAIACWITTFVFYVWIYAPILTHPRVDGKPE